MVAVLRDSHDVWAGNSLTIGGVVDSNLSQSLLLAKHLRARQPLDPRWVNKLDELFIHAAYQHTTSTPFIIGPDGLPYFGFHVARDRSVPLIDFKEAIDAAIHWGSGGVIYPGAGIEEWVYSPGDLVSLAACGTSALYWQGDWGKDPIMADYQSGSASNIGKPSIEFFPSLAARSLEMAMRNVFAVEPKLATRVPSIALSRPASRTRPEQASELILNVFREDFEDQQKWESFQLLVRRFVPAHIARRLIAFDSAFLPDESFTPLHVLISEGELSPVPDASERPTG